MLFSENILKYPVLLLIWIYLLTIKLVRNASEDLERSKAYGSIEKYIFIKFWQEIFWFSL